MNKNVLSILLVAIYPILFFYVNNISELSLIFLKIPILISVFISIVFVLLLNILLKNINKTTIIISVLLTIFFSYGHISNNLNNKLFIPLPGDIILGPDKILLPLVFLFILIFVYKMINTKNDLSKTITFINVFVTVLCLNSLFTLIKIETKRGSNSYQANTSKSNQTKMIVDTPDIYHIILDGYARNDVLKDFYNYDNSNFITSLEKMGFFVATKARSNYIHTYLSLPSTFNMQYLDDLPKKYSNKPVDNIPAINLMLHNSVNSKLQNYGYKTINFISDWSGTNENYQADIIINEGKIYKIFGVNIPVSESNMVFLKTTLLSPLIQDVYESALRKKTLSVFEKMPDIAYIDSPKYVLAHIMSPHPPYVFQADGSQVTDAKLVNADEGVDRRLYYLGQLKFISKQTISMIQKIINNSKKPPIIILQSDHGPASILGSRDDWKLNYSHDAVRERSSILYAVFLPDKKYSKFYQTITPVNTYPIIFNQYFKENNSLLPDKTYYTDYREMYGFYEIK